MALYRARQSGERPLNTPVVRTCTACLLEKPAAAFRRTWHNDAGLEAKCRVCIAAESRNRLYGVDPATFAAMSETQGHVCAICGQPEKTMANNGERVKDLAVDHDHRTGKVRGLLCANCNKGLGNLGDNPDTLMAAVAYLLQHADVLVGLNQDGEVI
jgi:hypothetical protein